MTDSPIIPPPELIEQWANHSASVHRENGTYKQHEFAIATQAARWGADQELEACCEWLRENGLFETRIGHLRAARRPKPPSLKEQALAAQQRMWDGTPNHGDWDLIRRALEALDD